jgi:uncharacterized protein (DUF952 family)
MEPVTGRIVHLCRCGEWDAALEAGEYQAASLQEVGFIHCSRPEQMLWVANRYFHGMDELALLWIDPHRVACEIRWETADGQVFPHIYGPLNLEAVVAVGELSPDPDGTFRIVSEPK